MTIDLTGLEAKATRILTEQWHGQDDVELAEGVIALCERVRNLETEVEAWKESHGSLLAERFELLGEVRSLRGLLDGK